MSHAEYLKRMRDLPPTIELAARVRGGLPLKDLAKELHMDPQGLANRFIAAGFMPTGESEKDFRRRQLREHLGSVLASYAEPWMAGAVCAQTDPDAFFPEKGGSTKEAKRVCLGCPVRETCLDWALARKEWFGVYGGKSERERRKILKERTAGVAA